MEPFYQRQARRQQAQPRRRNSGTLGRRAFAATAGSTETAEAAEEPKSNFTPARPATIPAGGEATVSFRGDSGEPFGFDHLTVGGAIDGLLASASTENGQRGLFNPVHVTALRTLFLRRRLKGLIKIAGSNELVVRLINPTAEAKTVIVQLSGYSGAGAIERQNECLRAETGGEEAPWPKLLVARDSVAAGADGYEIPVPGRAYEVSFRRFLVGSDTDLSQLRVALKLYSDVVYEEVYGAQLLDAFRELEATRPYIVEPRVPLKLAVTNESGAEADVSVLFEAYRQ